MTVNGIFRVIFVVYVVIVNLNLDLLLGVGATPVEKVLLISAGLLLALSRGVHRAASVWLALIIVVAVVSALMTDFSGFQWGRFARGLISLAAPWVLLVCRPRIGDAALGLRIFAWLPIANVVTGLCYQLIGRTTVMELGYSGIPRLQGASIPSGLGSMCLVGAVSALLFAHRFERSSYYYLLGINIVLLTLTAARGPFAIAALVLPVIYVAYCKPPLTRMLGVFLALPLAGAIIFLVAGSSMGDRIINGSLSGREMLWADLESVRAEHWTFGIGVGHQIEVVSERTKSFIGTVAAHNEYLRLSLECGYIGGVGILCCFTGMLFSIWAARRVNYSLAFFISVVGFLVFARNDNALSSAIIPFIIILVSFALPEASAPERVQTRSPSLMLAPRRPR